MMAKNDHFDKLIGNSLGHFDEVDLDPDHEWGDYMHIKVTLDITKPLLRKRSLWLKVLIWCGLASPMNAYQTFATSVGWFVIVIKIAPGGWGKTSQGRILKLVCHTVIGYAQPIKAPNGHCDNHGSAVDIIKITRELTPSMGNLLFKAWALPQPHDASIWGQ